MKKEATIMGGHVLIHPTRYAIIRYLMEDDGAHLSKITEELEKGRSTPIDRRLVSFHLMTLEKFGFVEGKYEVSTYSKSKGRAIKRYFLTKKVHDVLSSLHDETGKLIRK